MADPLSLAASIIAVLQLTAQVVIFVNELKNAPKEQAQLAIEASNLLSLLTRLRYRVEEARADEPWFTQVKKLGAKDGPLDQCTAVMEKTTSQLQTLMSSNRVKSVIGWKFKKGDFEDMRKAIDRLLPIIQFALDDDLFRLSQAIKQEVASVSDGIQRLEAVLNKSMRADFATWLGVQDDTRIYEVACKKRTAGTGQWLINAPLYNTWKHSTPSSIWLCGGPGCGKTILSSLIVEDLLLDPAAIVAYFFFDFKKANHSSFDRLCRTLLLQVASQSAKVSGILQRLYDNSMGGRAQPRSEAVVSELKIALRGCGQCYLIIDALDECPSREDVLLFMEDLLTSSMQNLSICLTSRAETDIETLLQDTVSAKINIDQTLIDQDIRIYVRHCLEADTKLKRWPIDIQSEIETVMMEKANGMFRWAFCQMDSLRRCLRPQNLRTALSSLPKSLHETYDRIFDDIEANGLLEDAIRILQWLCYSRRPLRVADMIEVLAVDREGNFSPENRLIDAQDIITTCSSFVSFSLLSSELSLQLEDEYRSDETDLMDMAPAGKQSCQTQVSLAHLSVREYLVSGSCRHSASFMKSKCDADMGELCLRYLRAVHNLIGVTKAAVPNTERKTEDAHASIAPSIIFTDFDDHVRSFEAETARDNIGPPRYTTLESYAQFTKGEGSEGGHHLWTRSLIGQYPLLTYSAWYWWRHLSGENVNPSPELVDMAIQSLEDMSLFWNQLYGWRLDIGIENGIALERISTSTASSLSQAASIGALFLVEALIKRGDDLTVVDNSHGTPLMCAEHFGHAAIVKLLRDHGGDIMVHLVDGGVMKIFVTHADDGNDSLPRYVP